MNKTEKLFAFIFVFAGIAFAFSFNPNKVEAAAQCTGQWPGPNMWVEVHEDSPTGPIKGSRVSATDSNNDGYSSNSATISVTAGKTIYFVGETTAYEFNSPSYVSYPYGQVISTLLEGPLPIRRVFQSSRGIDSNTSFHWDVTSVCQGGAVDPSWSEGYGEIDINVTLSAPSPTANIFCNGAGGSCTIASGSSATISWNSANASSCSISPTGWGGTSGSSSTGSLSSARTYSISCNGSGVLDSVTVNISGGGAGPSASIFCNGAGGSCTISSGASATISWNSSNASNCAVSPTGWSGTSGSQSTGPLSSARTYSISCNGSGVLDDVTVNIAGGGGGPTANIYCNGSDSSCSIPSGSSATISWNSSSASSCSISPSGWTGTSGSQSTGALSADRTYSISCNGSGALDSVTVNVSSVMTCDDNVSASFLSGIPASLTPGQVVSFQVRATNTGSSRYKNGDYYHFVQTSPVTIPIVSTAPAIVAGVSWGHYSYSPIDPNDSETWTFNLTAPNTPGTYTFSMQMQHDAGREYYQGFTGAYCKPGPASNTLFGQAIATTFTVANPNLAPSVVIDTPSSGTTVSGTITVGGWAIDNTTRVESAISSVILRENGVQIGGNLAGTANRPDVCAAYPGRIGCDNVGYSYSWNTSTLSNGSHTFSVTATDATGLSSTVSRTINVQNTATILVQAQYAAASGMIGAVNFSGGQWEASIDNIVIGTATNPTSSATYTPTPGRFRVRAFDIPNFNATVTGNNIDVAANGSYNVTITYTPQVSTINASTNQTGGGWTVRNNNAMPGYPVGTVLRSGSGPTVDTFSLPVAGGSYTFTTLSLATWETRGVEVSGVLYTSSNTPLSCPVDAICSNFTAVNGATIPIIGQYHRPAPNAPTSFVFPRSRCETLTINWTDNSTNENGFALYYRTNPTDPSTEVAINTSITGYTSTTGSRSYFWSDPPIQTMYIVARAYIDYPPRVYSTPDLISSAIRPMDCFSDLSASTKRITKVNWVDVGSSVNLKDGDRVTFEIFIRNVGTDSVQITSIDDVLRPNMLDDGNPMQLTKPNTGRYGWNFGVDKNGDGTYDEVTGSSMAANDPANPQNLTITIAGQKCSQNNYEGCGPAQDAACPNATSQCNAWAVKFDAIVTLASPDVKTDIWNSAWINYVYNSVANRQYVQTIKYLLNTDKPKTPQFREVSPTR